MRHLTGRRGLTLLETSVSILLLSGLTLGLFGLLNVAQGQVSHSGRIVQSVTGGFRLRARSLSLLRTAPFRLAASADWPSTTPVGWSGTSSPSIVKGAGTNPDELLFFVPVAVDLDANGLLGPGEVGLGAAGVLGDYYRIHVLTLDGVSTLVRDRCAASDGSVIRREALASPVAPPRTSGTADEARPFLVEVPGVDPRALSFRLRLGHTTTGPTGQTVFEHERSYDVTISSE